METLIRTVTLVWEVKPPTGIILLSLDSAVKFLFTLFRNSLNFTVSLSRIACWFYRVLFLTHTSFSLKSVVKVDTGWLVTVKERVPTTETARQESGREQHRLVHVSRASGGGSNSVHLDSVSNVNIYKKLVLAQRYFIRKLRLCIVDR